MNAHPRLLFFILLVVGFGETSAAESPPPPDVIKLNPFLVTEGDESGYRATSTLLGSRLNTPLRDLPGSISVFTKDFLDDIGATDIKDIIRYDLNVQENHGDAEAAGGGAEAN
jgi:outer membrane receptor for ferric coprogen and ferric-rhodotorulic acid